MHFYLLLIVHLSFRIPKCWSKRVKRPRVRRKKTQRASMLQENLILRYFLRLRKTLPLSSLRPSQMLRPVNLSHRPQQPPAPPQQTHNLSKWCRLLSPPQTPTAECTPSPTPSGAYEVTFIQDMEVFLASASMATCPPKTSSPALTTPSPSSETATPRRA